MRTSDLNFPALHFVAMRSFTYCCYSISYHASGPLFPPVNAFSFQIFITGTSDVENLMSRSKFFRRGT